MVRKVQKTIFVGLAYITQPFRRYSVVQQFIVGDLGKKRSPCRCRLCYLNILRDENLLNGLANLHQLRSTRFWMRFQFPSLGPGVCLVVMIHVAEQQTAQRFVHDQADVGADAHRPEVLVLGLVDLVQLHPGVDRIKLQVEGSGLDGFLLVSGQTGEAVGKSVGDAEVHAGGNGRRCGCESPRLPSSNLHRA